MMKLYDKFKRHRELCSQVERIVPKQLQKSLVGLIESASREDLVRIYNHAGFGMQIPLKNVYFEKDFSDHLVDYKSLRGMLISEEALRQKMIDHALACNHSQLKKCYVFTKTLESSLEAPAQVTLEDASPSLAI